MIKNQNFSGIPPADLPDEFEFENCNFSKLQPDTTGAAIGVRLWPGDDRPRTFIDCNLPNCEVPPGSTVTGCNTSVVELAIQADASEDFVVEVDGVEVSRRPRFLHRVHGRYTDADTFDRLPTPDEVFIEND